MSFSIQIHEKTYSFYSQVVYYNVRNFDHALFFKSPPWFFRSKSDSRISTFSPPEILNWIMSDLHLSNFFRIRYMILRKNISSTHCPWCSTKILRLAQTPERDFFHRNFRSTCAFVYLRFSETIEIGPKSRKIDERHIITK